MFKSTMCIPTIYKTYTLQFLQAPSINCVKLVVYSMDRKDFVEAQKLDLLTLILTPSDRLQLTAAKRTTDSKIEHAH